MRLDKYLSNNTEYSRKDVKRILRADRVRVNGELTRNSALNIPVDADVTLDESRIEPLGLGYFMMNKPLGAVCANSDPEHETVFDLMNEPHDNLHIAGRLDIDTTGLVLVTGDGKWSHQITSPRFQCEKSYVAVLSEAITDRMIEKLEQGVVLQGESQRTAPAKVEKIAEDEIRLIITEGRYHQVKRMLACVGSSVAELHRERIGNIQLDPELQIGEYRALTTEEITNV
jgi:16S rRNA pseudouridine516 synthase